MTEAEKLDQLQQEIAAIRSDLFSIEEKLDQLLSTELYITLTRQDGETGE